MIRFPFKKLDILIIINSVHFFKKIINTFLRMKFKL